MPSRKHQKQDASRPTKARSRRIRAGGGEEIDIDLDDIEDEKSERRAAAAEEASIARAAALMTAEIDSEREAVHVAE